MAERFRGSEQSSAHEYALNPIVVEALRGVISEPIKTTSHKPGHEGGLVEVRIVKEGPGMFGLTDWRDNREWAGIMNHVFLSERYYVHFAQQMVEAGMEVNIQRGGDGMLGSHPGRRQWDEAGWYPEVVEEAEAKRSISNETLGMQLIQGKVPQDVFELVVALGHNVEGFSVDPSIYDSWDYKLAIYVDHRTAQKYESLNTRMGDFLLGNFFKRDDVTVEVREQVYAGVKEMIDRQIKYRLGEVANSVSLDEADNIAEELGARPDSERLSRRELMRLVLQDADTEAALIQAGIDPDNINDEAVPMPKWEDGLRRLYIEAAEVGIFQKYAEAEAETEGMLSVISAPKEDYSKIESPLNINFPQNTWWGSYVRKLYREQEGVPRSV